METAEPRAPGPPLGLSDLTGAPPGRTTLCLGPGDQVLFCTDGLTEARDGQGGFYPLTARAGGIMGAPPHEALRLLREDVARHVQGPVDDDSALLVLERPRRAASMPRGASRDPGPGTRDR
ncbi:PP2C family protein-serine/threonine phosphatase [Streptomyces sp. NPDC021224]|uniref:PP2C family protein-serine/threonine phosphatase n=1 Tax=unclassified Streptomyces TaxID=2593676 RepID=UPI0037B94947